MTRRTAQIETLDGGMSQATLALDGEWGLASLPKLMRTWEQLYDFTHTIWDGSERTFTIRPFRGGFSTVHFYGELHRFVQPESRTELRSIHYSSPGAMELTGLGLAISAVCWTVNRIVNAWDNVSRVYYETQRRKRELEIKEIDASRSKLAYNKEQWEFIKQASADLKEALPLGDDWIEEFEKRTRDAPLAQLQILLGLIRRCGTFKAWMDRGQLELPTGKKPALPKGGSKKKSKGGKKARKNKGKRGK